MTCFLYPDIGRVDEPVQLHMDGFFPFETVTVKARYIDRTEGLWTSSMTVKADEQGKIQLKSEDQQSIQRLLSSLKPTRTSSHGTVMQRSGLDPMEIEITMLNEREETVLERTITRLFLEDHIERETVFEEGFVGTFFYPRDEKNLPGVILLGGSEGGLYEETASVLSSHGYAVLALAYFGEPGLSPILQNIPLETVDRAVEWLSEKSFVNHSEIATMGTSKGGELALVSASYNEKIRLVVGEVPSSHVFQGINRKRKGSSWSRNGEPLPFVKYSYSFSALIESLTNQWRKEPVSLRDMYERSLEKNKRDEAEIRVENINGPILLLSSGQDQVWPSSAMCESMMKRLSEHHFAYEKKHVQLEDAGHVLTLPYLPSVLPKDLPYELGGTEQANAEGGRRSWEETLCFLEKHFHPAKPKVETVMLHR
ncbi:acyl-CoA thioester hydrolase/BAAT C-terminal domain-containing protein [Alteribacter aurantiacus]|uniref:acyl-CoA thioester hydrolase/BAAT C-terminal domain-containing protein n=1 Tax=Alteribacter aurantiacus TaxID=254410 RepID=UPI00040D373A|nr:acyl-CoA thioester hydrolase/BAAT C-terminal domain-containing protein [Alteribacter aurantiacus]